MADKKDTYLTMFLYGEINKELCVSIKSQIFHAIENSESYPIKVKLFIDSFGGDVFSALGLIDVLLYLQHNDVIELVCIANGECFSAAFWVFLTGNSRKAFPHTLFMSHLGSIDAKDFEAKSATDFMKVSDVIIKRLISKLITKTKLTEKDYYSRVNSDWWFDSKTALKLGIATEVLKNG